MLLTTFGITVVFDLVLAVQIGVVLAAFLFMKRMADVTHIGRINGALTNPDYDWDYDPDGDPGAVSRRQIPDGVQVYEVNGPFFFGVADKLRDILNIVEGPPKVMVLRMRHVPVIDAYRAARVG